MAVGSKAKKEITEKILETFEGSFLYNDGKEIRIPIMEDGSLRQIKVTLTCAKTNVTSENGDASSSREVKPESAFPSDEPVKDFMQEPSDEEKKRVEDLCQKLGILK